MDRGSILAYLGGLVDGDGYFKITANFRTPRIKHPYYANVLGVSQLWPGLAVREFALVLGGEVKQTTTKRGTPMARCELRGRVAAAAARRLIPFLLVKRDQALLFLEAVRLRPSRHGRTLASEMGHAQVGSIVRELRAMQQGERDSATPLPMAPVEASYGSLTPIQLGWTREETLAYLAGIMDSDGNFRIYLQTVCAMRWPHYRMNIRCAQVEPSKAVQLLSTTFGGRITKKKARWENHRDLVEWNLHDRAASIAIDSLLPYLRVKWVEACLLLELRHMKSLGMEDLTEWEHLTRWKHYARMRKRSYSAGQVAEFERVRQELLGIHRNGAAVAYRPCNAKLSSVSEECLQ